MPTGLTHLVQKGEMTELRDFALRCARNMGALVMMRDEPMDAEIPEFEPSDYHGDALMEAEDALTRLRTMTPEEIKTEHRAAFDEAIRHIEEFRERKELEEARYRSMRRKVEAWAPPSPDHDGLKKLMLEQIDTSIKFDCGDYVPSLGVDANPEKWWQGRVRKAEKDIKRHGEELENEFRHCEERNEWVRKLKESL